MIRKFIDRSAPVQPDQYAAEFGNLLRLFIRRKPARILEIGTAEGGTLYQWMKYAPCGAQITAIDLPGGHHGKPGTEKYVPLWQKWAKKFGVDFAYFLGDSKSGDAIKFASSRAPYDFIFIDGDHRYPSVLADWLNYSGMARLGGVVVFHDILPHADFPDVDVWELWRDIRQSLPVAEYVSSAYQDSRGIGVVYV